MKGIAMKKLIIIFACGLFILSLNNCDDFLDRNPSNSLSKEDVWKSDEYAVNAINGLYKVANQEYALQGYGVRFSSWGPDGFNYFYSSSMETGIATSSESYFLNFYTGWYNMIRVANEIIYNLNGNEYVSPDLRDRLIGEAKYFRGMGHFLLWHFFKDVVIRDKPLSPGETNLPKSPADSVLIFCRQDFNDASEILPVSYDDNEWGRITKGAAITMLGKTYLYNKEWDLAATEFRKLLTTPFNYDLLPNYAELFDWKTEKNEEVIQSLQFIGVTDYGSAYDSWYGTRSNNSYGGAECVASYVTMSNYTYKDGNAIDFSTRPKRSDYADEESYGIDIMDWYNHLLENPNLDKRLNANIIMPTTEFLGKDNAWFKLYWPYSAYSNLQSEPYALRLEFSNYALLPWRKLVNIGTENTKGSPNDFPLIRFADVLLMYAEAVNEDEGPTTDVYNAINKVRARAGLDPLPTGMSETQMQREIRLERLREFAGEGHLFLDVRRWGLADTSDPVFGLNNDVLDFRGEKLFKRSFPKKYYEWPIPQADLEINKAIEQNPLWVE